MAQSAFLKGKAPLVRTETVKISNSVLAQRIQQFSLTLIGRLMNPSIQRMESLVTTLPKIWKLEDKVVGAELGQGTFQFNFAEEIDLQGVLQNGKDHFDGWMISLVKWEPIISSTYPSAINFWVKVAGITMHLWEIATLEAIGKKLGTIREIDEETGSVCVTINGFNPFFFKMAVPFDSGDEVVVTLEYEKQNGYCDNCYRLTHEERECPELNKAIGSQGVEFQADKRGVQRHQGMVNSGVFHNDGGWEKPRKFVKRVLDFQAHEPSTGVGSSGSYHQERHHGSVWEQKRSYGAVAMGLGGKRGSQSILGEHMGQAPSFPLNRKGSGSVWPKPLYKAKSGQKDKRMQEGSGDGFVAIALDVSQRDTVMESSPQHGADKALVGSDFDEATDDLLFEGDASDGNLHEEGEVALGQGTEFEEGMGSGCISSTEDDLKGDGHRQKVLGNKALDGKPAGGGRPVKKGMVALPKPPVRT